MASAPILPFAAFLGNVRAQSGWDGLSFSEVVDRADEEIPLHTHEEAHFFLLLRGHYVTSARGTDGVCSPSTLMFLPRWTTHRDHFRDRGGSFFTISIEPALLSRVAGDQTLVDCASALTSAECKTLAYKIYDEFRTGDAFSPAVMAGLTLELLAWAARLSAPRDERAPRWLRGVTELVHDRCGESLTVEELARTAGVHPLHFAKTFRKVHRCSPGEYIRRSRLERASGLLRASRTPIAQVAVQCGFSDQSQFTKTFKRQIGMTPAEFRRSFRE